MQSLEGLACAPRAASALVTANAPPANFAGIINFAWTKPFKDSFVTNFRLIRAAGKHTFVFPQLNCFLHVASMSFMHIHIHTRGRLSLRNSCSIVRYSNFFPLRFLSQMCAAGLDCYNFQCVPKSCSNMVHARLWKVCVRRHILIRWNVRRKALVTFQIAPPSCM